jgi:hypothetical protein
LNILSVSAAVEWRERATVTVIKDHVGSRQPVGVFGVDQMANHIKDTPGSVTFIAVSPRLREITQKGVESSRRAREKGYCSFQILIHQILD